jgi:hypothetical protein
VKIPSFGKAPILQLHPQCLLACLIPPPWCGCICDVANAALNVYFTL